MKALTWLRPAGNSIPLFALTVLLIGCSTTKKVDWNSRVGSYTYDQAIIEYGPPDKQAKLGDGRTVVEWITRHSGGAGLSIGTGTYAGGVGVGVSQSVGTGYSDRSLKTDL
jgi:hypothetical protein